MTIQKSKNKTQKRIFGDRGESIACGYLRNHGYDILKRNYNCKFGEIDIIARKEKNLIFVEVKTRTGNYFGEPQEFVNFQKLEKMNMAIDFFINEYDVPEDYILRIDVVEILFDESGDKYKLNHIEDFNN
ncbi:MAG TPA: YraN family protein [Patescibacteria group bacterium]|nr:YraN family protein [Patescibacteria group bacterium]